MCVCVCPLFILNLESERPHFAQKEFRNSEESSFRHIRPKNASQASKPFATAKENNFRFNNRSLVSGGFTQGNEEMGGLDSTIRDRSNAKLASSNTESQKRSAIGVAG